MKYGSAPEVVRDRTMIQYVRNGVLYATEDHWVFRSRDNGNHWEVVCRLEPRGNGRTTVFKDFLLRSRPVRSIRRNIGIHNLVVLESGTVLIQYDGIYRYNGESGCARRVFGFRENSVRTPLKNGFVLDEQTGNVYWGEYRISRREPVKIFRGTEDGKKWEECFRFPAGRIRHVHSIVPDRFRNRLWICTGDSNEEAALFYTDDDFKSVHVFNGGSQSWRMVSLIPAENALYWGSDAGKDAPPNVLNYVYKWDFTENRKVRLACIDKPAYYSTRLNNGTMLIGVHYEPETGRNVSKSAELWASIDGDRWQKIFTVAYKPFHRKTVTDYASIFLPSGDGTASSVFFTLLNVQQHDFSLMRIDFGCEK